MDVSSSNSIVERSDNLDDMDSIPYGVEGSPNVDVTAPIAAQAETPKRIKSSERVATPVSSVKDI